MVTQQWRIQDFPDGSANPKWRASSGSSGRVRGGARNMKSMWPSLVAIFFMTYFYRALGRGAWSLRPPPWICYCVPTYSANFFPKTAVEMGTRISANLCMVFKMALGESHKMNFITIIARFVRVEPQECLDQINILTGPRRAFCFLTQLIFSL